jgi:1-acyl-sn-glycerol-3-phosphate acyltransferase
MQRRNAAPKTHFANAMKYLQAEGLQNPLTRPAGGNAAIIAFRSTRLIGHLLYGLLLASAFPLLGPGSRRALMRYWSRALLHILRVKLEIGGNLPSVREQGALLVANHMSWLDVFVINAANPSCFVAKSEVRSWPLIGLLCRLTRTVFIERSFRRDTLRANRVIGDVLANGESVALFPEGTSTDGSQVRHFHSSLLQCAIDTGTCVQPIAIRYHDGTGLRSEDANYIGDMSLVQSLLNIMRSRALHAKLDFLPEISSLGKSRRILAEEAHAVVSTALAGTIAPQPPIPANDRTYYVPVRPVFATQSAYSLLLDPLIGRLNHRI